MSDKITVEEMVNHLIRLNRLAGFKEKCPTCESIRSHLTESDLAHWMDRCHELEVELAKKQTVSRKILHQKIYMQDYPGRLYCDFFENIISYLTKRGIKVSDSEGDEQYCPFCGDVHGQVCNRDCHIVEPDAPKNDNQEAKKEASDE